MIPQVDPLGRVYVSAGGTPAYWNSGVGYDAAGRMCTTTALGANDVAVGAWRLDPLGRVVVAAPGGPLFYNDGLPFNSNGSMARVVDTAPAASDPYNHGIRVQPAGGVHFTTAAPPALLSGFDSGFDGGFGT